MCGGGSERERWNNCSWFGDRIQQLTVLCILAVSRFRPHDLRCVLEYVFSFYVLIYFSLPLYSNGAKPVLAPARLVACAAVLEPGQDVALFLFAFACRVRSLDRGGL